MGTGLFSCLTLVVDRRPEAKRRKAMLHTIQSAFSYDAQCMSILAIDHLSARHNPILLHCNSPAIVAGAPQPHLCVLDCGMGHHPRSFLMLFGSGFQEMTCSLRELRA